MLELGSLWKNNETGEEVIVEGIMDCFIEGEWSEMVVVAYGGGSFGYLKDDFEGLFHFLMCEQ